MRSRTTRPQLKGTLCKCKSCQQTFHGSSPAAIPPGRAMGSYWLGERAKQVHISTAKMLQNSIVLRQGYARCCASNFSTALSGLSGISSKLRIGAELEGHDAYKCEATEEGQQQQPGILSGGHGPNMAPTSHSCFLLAKLISSTSTSAKLRTETKKVRLRAFA